MPGIDMPFQVGDIVKFLGPRSVVMATVIATQPGGKGSVVVGWRPDEDSGSFGWPLDPGFGDGLDVIPHALENFNKGWWVPQELLILVERKAARAFMRINQKTLRKRMRDQIAQEIYKL